MTGWYRADSDGAVIFARVRPNARNSAISGPEDRADGGQSLGIRLAAKPVDGAANKALTGLLAKELGVAKSAVRLISGQNNRNKRLRIIGDWADLEPRLVALAGGTKEKSRR